MLLFAHFCIFWHSTIFTQRTLERTLCRSIFIVCRSIFIVCILKNPIILANLGEPIPTPVTFKGQVQKACPMWPQVKVALVK